MHIWTDYLFYEIINPHTGQRVKEGQSGELVITTLAKEVAPLIRYRTHDLTRELPGVCPCGLPWPRIDTLIGRSDDMVKVKGVMIFPGKIDEMLSALDGVSSEYQVMIDHLNGKDIVTLFFETSVQEQGALKSLAETVQAAFKEKIGITAKIMPVGMGELPRSEKKTTRVFDNRY
jgi:phenylacetate-CoA ligase